MASNDILSLGQPYNAVGEPVFTLTVHYHNQPIEVPIHDADATIQDLSDLVAEERIPPSNQKFLISPKVGLLKPPFKDKTLRLETLVDKKIVLMGATTTEVAELESDIAERKARIARRQDALRAGRRIHASRRHDPRTTQANAINTFHKVEALPYLPNPEKSLRFLERLKDDAGIRASMRKHGFSVGLLTELNPAEHTTHESKTLGLNKNHGEIIYLRLRTDAYDGYRDYKVIRKTLCHELAHNVWGDHDSNFWKLCKEIEAEVDKNDWRRGGHSVGSEEFYNPNDEGVNDEDFVASEEHSWQGGVHVLGGASSSTQPPTDRRDAIARAAEARANEERLRKAQQQPKPDEQ